MLHSGQRIVPRSGGQNWVGFSAVAPALMPEWMNEPARSTAVSAMSAAVFTHSGEEQRSAAPFRSAIATADRSRRYRTRFAAQHSARRHRRVPFSCQPSLSSLSFQSYPWPLCTVALRHSPRPPHACSAVLYAGTAVRLATGVLQRGVGCWWTEGPQEERIGPQGTRCLHSALRRVACCLLS